MPNEEAHEEALCHWYESPKERRPRPNEEALWHWYDGYSEPGSNSSPPPGAVALCGHVRETGVPDTTRPMRTVDEFSCMTCVRLRLGKVIIEDCTDDELRALLGDA